MPVTSRLVPLRNLLLLPELSPRAGLSEETVLRYMDSFDALPPIRVQAGSLTVIDGFHRAEAAQRMGLELVPVTEVSVPDEELRLAAGLANADHGQPLTRAERNRLAVALVRNYGKLRDEVAKLLGMSPSAITLALREQQFNDQLSEKLGTPVQVINSAHVRAMYRVGPEQRERLLEAVVGKLDEDGRPYPLTGAELKLLVDRMLDPATPPRELERLLTDPRARPGSQPAPGAPFVPEPGAPLGAGEQAWQSPLKGGDTEAGDRLRAVDEEVAGSRERQLSALLRRAQEGEREPHFLPDEPGHDAGSARGGAPSTGGAVEDLLLGVSAAHRALAELAPQVEPPEVRRQVEAVVALLESLAAA